MNLLTSVITREDNIKKISEEVTYIKLDRTYNEKYRNHPSRLCSEWYKLYINPNRIYEGGYLENMIDTTCKDARIRIKSRDEYGKPCYNVGVIVSPITNSPKKRKDQIVGSITAIAQKTNTLLAKASDKEDKEKKAEDKRVLSRAIASVSLGLVGGIAGWCLGESIDDHFIKYITTFVGTGLGIITPIYAYNPFNKNDDLTNITSREYAHFKERFMGEIIENGKRIKSCVKSISEFRREIKELFP